MGRLDRLGLVRLDVGAQDGKKEPFEKLVRLVGIPCIDWGICCRHCCFPVACLKGLLFLFFPFQIIQSLGYNRLVLQIGRGKVVPEPFSSESFTLDVYRYKDSLKEDLQKADLVISHAGKVP